MLYSVTIEDGINRAPFGAPLYPGVDYLFNAFSWENFKEYIKTSGLRLGIAEPFHYTKWNGEEVDTLLIYNTGKLGDQLWTTAVVRAIKQKYPRTQIDVVCDNGGWQVWRGNKDVRGRKLLPLPTKALDGYDGVLIFDDLVSDRHDPEQPNCYDILFDYAGLSRDPLARPYVYPLLDDELSIYRQLFKPDEDGRVRRTRGDYVVGIHSSGAVRTMTANQTAEVIIALCQNTEGRVWGISNDGFGADVQTNLVKLGLPNYVACHDNLSIPQLAALCHYAACVVSPDSMLVHLAASQGAATVALMSTVPPKYRVATYPNCVPLWKPCKYGDCFYKHPTFHYQIGDVSEHAKCDSNSRSKCDVLTFSTQDIFDAMSTAMNRRGKISMKDLPTH